MKRASWRRILDCIVAALSVALLCAYAVMLVDGDLLPVPLWLSLFAMLPVLPVLAIVWLSLTAKTYVNSRHTANNAVSAIPTVTTNSV